MPASKSTRSSASGLPAPAAWTPISTQRVNAAASPARAMRASGFFM
jgi:hypothetical protein